MSETKPYSKIEDKELRSMVEQLHQRIGYCDQIANDSTEKAYDELREQIDLFLDDLKENKELVFE